jgi:hypothetical protein
VIAQQVAPTASAAIVLSRDERRRAAGEALSSGADQ